MILKAKELNAMANKTIESVLNDTIIPELKEAALIVTNQEMLKDFRIREDEESSGSTVVIATTNGTVTVQVKQVKQA